MWTLGLCCLRTLTQDEACRYLRMLPRKQPRAHRGEHSAIHEHDEIQGVSASLRSETCRTLEHEETQQKRCVQTYAPRACGDDPVQAIGQIRAEICRACVRWCHDLMYISLFLHGEHLLCGRSVRVPGQRAVKRFKHRQIGDETWQILNSSRGVRAGHGVRDDDSSGISARRVVGCHVT